MIMEKRGRGHHLPFLEIIINVFKRNSEYTGACGRAAVHQYFKYLTFIEYKCVDCGITDMWNGQKITLQVDHVNGINNDHRIINLCWRCPNCHSQTKTFCNPKNKYRKQLDACTRDTYRKATKV